MSATRHFPLLPDRCPLLLPLLSLVCGILMGRHWLSVVTPWMWLAGGTIAVVMCLLIRRQQQLASLLLLIATALVGALLSSMSFRSIYRPLPTTQKSYQAVVMSNPVRHGKMVQCDLLVLGQGKPILTKASFLRDTISAQPLTLRIGEGISATSYLEPPHNYADATFDYAQWLRLHGYQAETFVRCGDWQPQVVSLRPLSLFQRALLRSRIVRQRLVDHLHTLPLTADDVAVTIAMSLGDRSSLSRKVKDDYSLSGASHVLALSGLHLGIIYALLMMLFARWHDSFLTQLLVMTAIWSYVFLVGMSPSVLRAATMLTVCTVVSMLHRYAMSVNNLLVSATVLLAVSPQTLFDSSFQLSFLAVCGIVLFVPNLEHWLPSRLQRFAIVRLLWQMTLVSIAAQLTTAPLVAYVFHQASPCFLLTNWVVVPCATLILYLLVATILLSWCAIAQQAMVWLLAFVVSAMNRFLAWVSSLPLASVTDLHPSAVQLVAMYMLIAVTWLIVYRLEDIRRQKAELAA